MLPPRALFAIGAVIIAGVFIASMVKSRGKTDRELASEDELEKYGQEQERKATANSCQDAIGHATSAAADYFSARYGEGAAESIRDIMVSACKRDGWPGEVVRCMDRVTSDNELQRCIGQLEDYQRRYLESEIRTFAGKPFVPKIDAGIDAQDTIGDDDFSVTPPPPPPPPPPPSTFSGTWSDIPECNEYGAMIEKLSQCDKLPQQSRDALKQGYDAMKQGWTNMNSMSDDIKKTMADACKQATEALTQAGRSMCGW